MKFEITEKHWLELFKRAQKNDTRYHILGFLNYVNIFSFVLYYNFKIFSGDVVGLFLISFIVSMILLIPGALIYDRFILGTKFHPYSVIKLRDLYLKPYGFERTYGYKRYEKIDGTLWALTYPLLDFKNNKITFESEIYDSRIHDCDP